MIVLLNYIDDRLSGHKIDFAMIGKFVYGMTLVNWNNIDWYFR